MASEHSSSSDALISRVQSFVADNRRAIVVGAAAAVAAGGVGYYLYSTRSGASSSAESDAEKGSRKKKSSSKKKRSKDNKDGPILEERSPKSKESVAESTDDTPKLTKEQIEALPENERLSVATTLKTKGNAAYQARKFSAAVDLYTQAIEVSPNPEAVYFSNRAACYVNYNPPQYDSVIHDCDEALKRDPQYVKALNRRANALEAVDRLHESLRDFTTATIFDKFQNDTTTASLERVLKKIAQSEAHKLFTTREPRLPSFTFIHAYLAAFRPRPLPVLPENPSQGDQTLLLAYEAVEAQDYPHAFTLINEAVDQGISWEEGKSLGFNLRGTFKFLIGDSEGARADLQKAIDLAPHLIQAWVKIASVHMDLNDTDSTFAAFASAIAQDATDADIYYHRGQVNFILQQFKEAEADYTKAMTLEPTFIFSQIQLAVAQYKTGQLNPAMVTFRKTMKAFPQRSEPLNYYGELLLDIQRFPDAVEKFDQAVEIERKKKPMNVLPLVNKALTIYQWQQDVPAAERLLREALENDPDCDSAIQTLAQLRLQQSDIPGAVELFTKLSTIARTEGELEQALTFKYATSSQLVFIQEFPHMAAQLAQLAQSMQGQGQ